MDNQQESTLLAHPLDSDYFVSVDGKNIQQEAWQQAKRVETTPT